MVPVEPISLSIGIATLFTTCIDCFEYFKVAKGFEQQFEVLLVKLEYQQERLLVWGDLAGVCNEKQDSDRPVLESELKRQDLTKRCLSSIRNLLKDSENLKTKYGLRPYTLANDTAPQSGISANALKRLRLRLSRQPPGPSVLDKTRWAIHDATKFEKLVGDIRDLIDGLTVQLPVSSELQEQKVQDDIASMVDDLHRLHLFQEACKDDYPKWWAAASAAIDASEVATLDNRLADERLDNYDFFGKEDLGVSVDEGTTPLHFGDSKVYIDSQTQVFFMLTESCRTQNTKSPCDQLNLAEMSFKSKHSFLARGSLNTRSAPGFRISSHINLRVLSCLVELDNYIAEHHAMKAHAIAHFETEPEVDIRYRVKVYVYCPPCACQVATALEICQHNDGDDFKDFRIRIDHRQKTTCSESFSGVEGLISVINHLKHKEKDSSLAVHELRNLIVFDREWMEQEIYNHTEKDCLVALAPANQLARIAGFHPPHTSCAAIVLLGEADHIIPLVGTPPFPPLEPGRILRETQLFRNRQRYLKPGKFGWEREFIGTYSSKDPLPAKRPAPAGSDTTQTLESGPPSSKRSRNSTRSQEESS